MFGVLFLVVLFFALGFMSSISKLSINEVEITGNESLDPTELAKSILQSLHGKKLLVYSKANIFLFSKTELDGYIMSTYPRVYRVSSIDRVKNKLFVEIEERHGAYTWCGFEAPSYEDRFNRGECYFLDQEGFAFDTAPDFSEGVYLSIYGGLPADGRIIGETINLQNNITDVAKMLKVLEANDLAVHSLVLGADGQHAFILDTVSLTGDYAKILWNEDAPLTDTLSKLASALSESNFKKQWLSEKEKLLYVDTRFNNRVFYKFLDGVEE